MLCDDDDVNEIYMLGSLSAKMPNGALQSRWITQAKKEKRTKSVAGVNTNCYYYISKSSTAAAPSDIYKKNKIYKMLSTKNYICAQESEH